MFCVYCGKTIDDDSKFCVYCGKRFDTAPGAGTYSGTHTAANSTFMGGTANGQAFQAAVCPCCCAPIRTSRLQCEYCGTPLIQNTPPVQAATQSSGRPVQVVNQSVQMVTQPSTPQYENGYSQSFQSAQPMAPNGRPQGDSVEDAASKLITAIFRKIF